MRVLATADWHIGLATHGAISAQGHNSRLTDVASLLQRVVAFAAQQRVDLFVQAGDIFHTNKPTPDEQAIFLDVLYALEDARIPSRFIIGNHDYTSQLGRGHGLTVFKNLRHLKYVKIYDQTTSERMSDVTFYFMPYKGMAPSIALIGNTVRVLVCHSHLQGAVVGSEPFEIPNDAAFNFAELPVDVVIAGHFHKPQLLSKTKPLAFYPGSIQAVDFNERSDVKGVVLLDTNTLTYRCAGFKTRKFYQIELIDMVTVPEASADSVKDAIVKVVVKIPEHMLHEYSETTIRNSLTSMGAHHIASITVDVERQRNVRDSAITVTTDVKANFLKYIADKDYGENKPLITQLGLGVITEVQEGYG